MPPPRSAPAGNIVLIGFMGSGKTAVARRVGELTGRRWLDTDRIVEESGLTISDIFASEGERGFRRRERDAVERAARAKDGVIATGGGVVLLEENVKALKKRGVLVYLRASEEELEARLADGKGRPLLQPVERGAADRGVGDRIRDLYAKRTPLYERMADVVVDVDGLGVGAVADEVLRRLGVARRAGRVQTIEVSLHTPYRIVVGRGILRRAAVHMHVPQAAEKACIVSHPRIARLWGDALAAGLKGTKLAVSRATFPEGEERKTIETVARLYRRLAALGFNRGDVVVALGGGVVGDVAGFVASTYARGVPLVQVPTTLLAMTDSSIGGKTGFNLPEGKNLIGTFHQPSAVLADLDTLKTLSDREFRGGLAETVKHALIADPPLGDKLVAQREAILAREDALEPVVVRSAEIKAGVVSCDERESGRRMILNYGHTIGHGLEALGLTGRLSAARGPGLHHGEAVSIGMVFAAYLAVLVGLASPGIVEEHLRLLTALGLPTSCSPVTWDELRRYVAVDKKYAKGQRFVLLSEPGKPEIVQDVPQRTIEEALRRTTEEGR